MSQFSILDSIGNTPMIDLSKLTHRSIFAKAEFLNPGGSIKDRIAKYMIEQAEKRDELKPGMTIIEPTSGNTGIGLAFVGVQKGYKVIIVMPEDMSEERKKIIRALGAELLLTPAKDSIQGSVDLVEKMCSSDKKLYMPNQFKNLDNLQIHYSSTGPEIWKQLNGNVEAFVSGVGSGGTLAGIGKFLKEKNPHCKIIAVEPKNVSALRGDPPGPHQIQGIGDGFIPDVLDISIIDDMVEVTDEDAIATARNLSQTQGLLVGVSSGANVWAATHIAQTFHLNGNICTILADRAERYFSMGLI